MRSSPRDGFLFTDVEASTRLSASQTPWPALSDGRVGQVRQCLEGFALAISDSTPMTVPGAPCFLGSLLWLAALWLAARQVSAAEHRDRLTIAVRSSGSGTLNG